MAARILPFLRDELPNHLPAMFAATCSIIVLAVITNIAQQILFKKENEPPLVFHCLPIIGSTVIYGMDPFKFFFDCQAKVGILLSLQYLRKLSRLIFCQYSQAIFSHSSFWAEKSPSILDQRVISSSSTANLRTSMPKKFTPSCAHPSLEKMWSMMYQTPNSWNRKRYILSRPLPFTGCSDKNMPVY